MISPDLSTVVSVIASPLAVSTAPLGVVPKHLIVITGLDPVIYRRGTCGDRWPGRGPAMMRTERAMR